MGALGSSGVKSKAFKGSGLSIAKSLATFCLFGGQREHPRHSRATISVMSFHPSDRLFCGAGVLGSRLWFRLSNGGFRFVSL